jgi:transcriptional regulator with XRE-family HTH domain
MTDPLLLAIGKRIRFARNERGLTQEELAKLVGKSKQLTSAWEAGRAQITSTTLSRLGQVLAVDIRWILSGGTAPHFLPAQPEGSTVPLLNAEQVILLAKEKIDLKKAEKQTFLNMRVSERAFAIEAPDGGLSPAIAKGDLIVVDPVLEIEPTSIVLAVIFAEKTLKLKRPVVMVREVRFTTVSAPKAPFHLVPTQTGFPSIDVRRDRDGILLGRLIWISKSLMPHNA